MIYWAALKNQSPKNQFHLPARKIDCAITFNLSKALDEAYIITTLYNNKAFWCQFISHSDEQKKYKWTKCVIIIIIVVVVIIVSLYE